MRPRTVLLHFRKKGEYIQLRIWWPVCLIRNQYFEFEFEFEIDCEFEFQFEMKVAIKAGCIFIFVLSYILL